MRQWQCVHSKLRVHVQYSRRLAAHHIESHKCRILHNANVQYIKSWASSDRQSSIVYWNSRRSCLNQSHIRAQSDRLPDQPFTWTASRTRIGLAESWSSATVAQLHDAHHRSRGRRPRAHRRRRSRSLTITNAATTRWAFAPVFCTINIPYKITIVYSSLLYLSLWYIGVLQDRQTSNLIVRWIACNESTEKFALTLTYPK